LAIAYKKNRDSSRNWKGAISSWTSAIFTDVTAGDSASKLIGDDQGTLGNVKRTSATTEEG